MRPREKTSKQNDSTLGEEHKEPKVDGDGEKQASIAVVVTDADARLPASSVRVPVQREAY